MINMEIIEKKGDDYKHTPDTIWKKIPSIPDENEERQDEKRDTVGWPDDIGKC